MNAVPKLVASHHEADVSAWANSRLIDGALVDTVRQQRRDGIITGSLSVVHTLMAEDLIDEYRLLTFPPSSALVGGSSRPTESPHILRPCRRSRPVPPS